MDEALISLAAACSSSCPSRVRPARARSAGRRSGRQRQRQLPDVVRAGPAAGFQSRASRCCIRSGSRRRLRHSTAWRRRIPRARWRIGAWRSADGAIHLPGCARRSRSSSGAPPFNARSRPARRRRASARTSRPPPSCSRVATPSTQRARTVAYEQGMERRRARVSRRHGGAHLLRARGEPDRAGERQEILAATEGRGHSRAALQGASEASGARALHHSRLRSPAARGESARRRAQLRVSCAVGAARAAHAVAYVHARRHVEGIDRDQSPIRRGRAQGERDRRSAARDGLPDVRLSADRRRTAMRGE